MGMLRRFINLILPKKTSAKKQTYLPVINEQPINTSSLARKEEIKLVGSNEAIKKKLNTTIDSYRSSQKHQSTSNGDIANQAQITTDEKKVFNNTIKQSDLAFGQSKLTDSQLTNPQQSKQETPLSKTVKLQRIDKEINSLLFKDCLLRFIFINANEIGLFNQLDRENLFNVSNFDNFITNLKNFKIKENEMIAENAENTKTLFEDLEKSTFNTHELNQNDLIARLNRDFHFIREKNDNFFTNPAVRQVPDEKDVNNLIAKLNDLKIVLQTNLEHTSKSISSAITVGAQLNVINKIKFIDQTMTNIDLHIVKIQNFCDQNPQIFKLVENEKTITLKN